jgi:TolA-binding protein
MPPSSSNTTKYIDLLMKFAALAVIPLIAWVVTLSVANAERDFQIQALYNRIDNLEEVNTAVQEYAVRLGQVDQKLESMEDTVDEIRQDIKDLLRREE